MPRFAPATRLETHEVTNQPPEFAGRDLYATDTALREAVRREGGDWLDAPLSALGATCGSEEMLELGDTANREPPELLRFDRYGRQVDEIRFHPAYHRLMDVATAHGIHDIAWRAKQPGGHVGHASMLAVFTQAEAGVMCPINMTYASVPALRHQPAVTQPWLDTLIGGTYDAPLRPIAEKSGITLGMAMTEKQGGSDVRANTTRAERDGEGWRLTGHKWFCSAPMSDGFLTLAYVGDQLSCFLVPRITPDGERNAIHVMRLKDKLGNKSNASSEIEYHGAFAWGIGEPGRGVRTIIEMVHHTRLGTISGTLGIMRRALAEAVHHVRHRRVFQKTLIDQAAMASVIADLAVEYEAAAALVMRIARAFDGADESERAFARLAVALAKYWLTKRCANFVYECMECLGGAGYVEEAPLARYYREAPLNAIWEGSGNVIALDIVRTLAKEPAAAQALFAELEAAGGADTRFDAEVAAMQDRLTKGLPAEHEARFVAERLALLLQASLLLRHAPHAVSGAFVATRIGGESGRSFGTLPGGADLAAIIARQ
ncbi:acyl-CoA dehydrogenase family protein [Stakelama tenebrarum]|uniref:DNA alkylation response protein n=1 Tax=Stakelama tenebrarum TaxID=2711215 RepID=A0A6G6Y5P0_9SPHN|nr:acyl-CoA dehydrogenase family protein [Sphingosinithalassobacter tenebrarum]QIG80038.1 DNA alkylation response protein [Sphingosinithalassobacter tenebrarum]